MRCCLDYTLKGYLAIICTVFLHGRRKRCPRRDSHARRGSQLHLGYFRETCTGRTFRLERDCGVKLRHKALLFRMFVAPKVAGRGFGNLLLQRALPWTRDIDDLRYVRLTVLERNQRARALYRSLGFLGFALEL
ncbi:MAG: GNAT family N-acetyltransferase [Acidithiobacillus sp.]